MSGEFAPHKVLDCQGLSCPLPILKTKKAMDQMEPGQILQMVSTDPGSKNDVKAWTRKTGNQLLDIKENGGLYIFFIKKV